ncbi:uncharacterized protein LOC100836573 isoform X1 [Brachypodium distachyon]|uniref:Uncharacterized protein n=1 Tax=Brachypodium distachyon TaxID=15368 RepID=I1HWY3_BRADI|nr:uncharacterized protein LOC100836573 isoform X1 [Brachypodium distachyon]KQJ93196.1 hypothetical protein BRADI_3g03130v3 [Brachypodium distachyon]|eukprot:XP_003574214.1 uncharacterized protein LOC100836573 isoform X1 [Brachypodium distachyon]
MADKPSRALVLYAAGHAALLPAAAAAAGGGGGKSHLDAFASLASCGFLSVRTPAVNDEGDKNSATIVELAQLLDVYDALYPAKDAQTGLETARVDPQELVVPKLSERFMGMRAAMVTNCPDVSSFTANLGFHVFRTEDFVAHSGLGGSSKDIGIINRAFGLLGFSEGSVQDASEFDLVFVHVAMENTASKLGKLGMKTDLNRLDKLVAAVMEAAPVKSAIAARVHVSVILSYGSATENKEESCLILNSSTETDSDLKLLHPRQSYTMKAGRTLDDVRNHHPMLLAQWQEGVTRSDLAKGFSFEEFIKRGGNFAMLAERFLHEVAFKLWKAPKYGA